MYRLQIVVIFFLTIFEASACSKISTEKNNYNYTKKTKLLPPPNIYGSWKLSKSLTDMKALRRRFQIYDPDFSGWPIIETVKDNQIVFRFTQNSSLFEPGSPDIMDACTIYSINWNPRTQQNAREFYINCNFQPNKNTFGGSEFLNGPKKETYNIRIFGDNFNKLRFQDSDGLVYFFTRAEEGKQLQFGTYDRD